MTYKDILIQLESQRNRSKWDKGVNQYAVDIVKDMIDNAGPDTPVPRTREALERTFLNGARSWDEYSRGGNALIYDKDIMERLFTKRYTKRKPENMDWLAVQATALFQAFNLILEATL